jgi:hypothetical protein
VSDFIDAVSARHPEMAVEVRCAYRHDGPLSPLVNMNCREEAIDLYRPTLREDSLNQMLSLPTDIEFSRIRGQE